MAQDKKGKRIIYIGNFRPFWSTENHVAISFEELGWGVKKIQENEMTAGQVLEESKKGYDFLLYTRTWAEVGRQYLELLKDIKIPTVSFHLDLYWGLDREIGIGSDPFFKSNYVFSADGGHQKEFKKAGINHYWLPAGVLRRECYLGKPREIFKRDVIFVGSFTYHQEWLYRKILIKWLLDTYGERFILFGMRESIRGDDLNDLYASAKVVVGDSCYSPYYWSDRIPETLGRGGFLIHPKVPGLEKEYQYYKHFIPYNLGDWGSLKEIIDYYIEADEEREKIRLAGHQFVKENHTYTNRVKTMLKVLEKEKKIREYEQRREREERETDNQ